MYVCMYVRACYGYKPFLTSTFVFIYQFMIQKAFKFIVKYIFGWNLSTKVPWWPFNISYHKFFTFHHPPFFSAFKRSLHEAYQWLGTETSPVIGLNYLIPVGQIWWRSEVMLRFTFFCDFPTNSSDIYDTGRKWVNCFRVVSL